MGARKTTGRLAIAAALSFGCADHGRVADPLDMRTHERLASVARVTEGRGAKDPVVVVTLDGVRWKEVFEGTEAGRSSKSRGQARPAARLAPNLYRIGVERGAFVGAPGLGTMSASGPNYVSLPGYTEILTGRPPVTCQDNGCPRTSAPTVLDEAHASGARVAVFASWGPYCRAATAVPGAFKTSCGRADAPAIDPYPGVGDYRPDRATAEVALEHLAAEQPDVLVLGLGDADEYAHRGDYDGYVASIARADEVLGRVLDVLDRSGERGARTHLVVTTDHGRAHGFRHHGAMPEAARVWMAAAGPRFAARGRVASREERRLADVAPTLRRVLGLPPDASMNAGRPIDELFAANEPPVSSAR